MLMISMTNLIGSKSRSHQSSVSSSAKMEQWTAGRILIASIVVIILGPLAIIPMAEGRQCYVCGTDSDAVFRLNGYELQDDLFFPRSHNVATVAATETTIPSHPSNVNGRKLKYKLPPPSCLGFEHSSGESLSEFIRDCPEGYHGCLTQIDGSEVVRTCDSLALNDCKVANKVTYCYCNGDLCNSRPASMFGMADQSNYDASIGEDDEDRVGRGAGQADDDDYVDEFSGRRPTAPFPGEEDDDDRGGYTKTNHPRGNLGRSSSSSSPDGGSVVSWSSSSAVHRANANSHTPFQVPPTTVPSGTSSGSSSFRESRSSSTSEDSWIRSRLFAAGPGNLLQSVERVLIAVPLFVIRNKFVVYS